MRKILSLLVAIFIFQFANAQTEHLKFMGIEINGTINDFQTKLKAKNVTVSPTSSSYPAGVRVFNGVFSGEDAEICVWYNTRTKEVYRAKAIIERHGKDRITQLLSNMIGKLDLKYGSDKRETELVKDDHLQEFEQSQYTVGNGIIGVFIVSTSYISQGTYYLHLDYYDAINSLKNTSEEMDDL